MTKKRILVTRGAGIYTGGFSSLREDYEFVYTSHLPVHAVLIPGGGDVSPQLYGHTNQGSRACSVDSDYKDMCHIANAKLEEIPIIGICKGAQLLHVSNGGTLIQDIEGHAGVDHHEITCITQKEPGKVEVNSTHHQAIPIEEAKKMYEIVYASADKQAVEIFICNRRKTYGFQFHPEYTTCPKSGYDLFQHFLKEVILKD